MYQEVSQLLMYGDLDREGILYQLGELFGRYEKGVYDRMELVRDINTQVKHILKVATDYGFDDNLWHNYLTFFLMMSENPFSLTCEKVGANEGTVNELVENDFRIFRALFDYDFDPIERDLGIQCFSRLSHYQAVHKKELMYNKNVSEKVRSLSRKLEQTSDEKEFFDVITGFYKDYGVGMFGLNKAFRIEEKPQGGILFRPINNMDTVMLSDLVGYEIQKKKLTDNTEAFVNGKKANNCLLYGDAGTGKSSCIKAIANEYYGSGLRIIEVYKHQFQDLNDVIAQIKNRNYKFIIYMDDLSFEKFEIEYKYLKAVIEGGLEKKPENVLIYATSNRRHLIRETFKDKQDRDEELHVNDTVQEKLSLVSRFGVSIYFGSPDKKQFQQIVQTLADRYGVAMSEDELLLKANQWELSHGGLSGRTAQQFIDYLLGQ